MTRSILIAGIGNIFHGDDAFGVDVARRLAAEQLPANVRLMDAGIRSIDLGFALLENYDLVILADAIARGGTPGTLYTLETGPAPQAALMNSHSLHPASVLAVAKSMGAHLKRVLVVGCEPLVLDRDDSGYIGLSEPVAAAVNRAAQIIRDLVREFTETGDILCHECA